MAAIGNKTIAAKYVTIDGVKKRVHEWVKELGLHYPTVQSRIVKHGYTPREAILEPVKNPRPDAHSGADPHLLRVIAEATGSPISVRRRGGRSTREINRLRQACMWAAYTLGKHTITDIGEFFGGKHHSTVVYHVTRFEEKLTEKPRNDDAWNLKLKIEKWLDMAIEEEKIQEFGQSLSDEASEVMAESGS